VHSLKARVLLPQSGFDWRHAAACVAVAAFLVPVTVASQDGAQPASDNKVSVPYFVTPPRPEQLATMLYPPRTRSVHAVGKNQATVAQPVPFSMAIHFEYDSARLVSESLPLLDSIGQMLNLPKVQREGLVIEGHTDARGSARYNANLALRRAQEIKRYLADSHKIDPTRMLTVSFGETRLANPENPADPRNRRAAFRPMHPVAVR